MSADLFGVFSFPFLGVPTGDQAELSVFLHWHCGFHTHGPREIHELFSRSSGKERAGWLELLCCLQHLFSNIFVE